MSETINGIATIPLDVLSEPYLDPDVWFMLCIAAVAVITALAVVLTVRAVKRKKRDNTTENPSKEDK